MCHFDPRFVQLYRFDHWVWARRKCANSTRGWCKCAISTWCKCANLTRVWSKCAMLKRDWCKCAFWPLGSSSAQMWHFDKRLVQMCVDSTVGFKMRQNSQIKAERRIQGPWQNPKRSMAESKKVHGRIQKGPWQNPRSMAESKVHGRIQGPWQNPRSIAESKVHGRIQGPWQNPRPSTWQNPRSMAGSKV
jgi:hypothetical protein